MVDKFKCPVCGHWCDPVDAYGWVCNKRGGCDSEWEDDEMSVGDVDQIGNGPGPGTDRDLVGTITEADWESQLRRFRAARGKDS